jgi:membrane-associated PAP2 superfamily phosphatase
MTHARRDGWVTLLAGLALLAWDASGADLWAARAFGNAQGFAARDSWWAATLLHDGGRLLAWLLLAAQVALLLWPTWSHPKPSASAAAGLAAAPAQPTRAARARWLGVVLVCVLVVPALKRLSSTSCPWDLALFGGVAQHLSHWRWGVADGGAGHCFPSGHAVAAFAFLGLYFLWRDVNPARARRWLWGVLALGALFGTAQLARGAHFPSHTLWSAWLCWALCAAAAALQRLPGVAVQPPASKLS